MISDEDRDGFVRQAQREGMTLSEWLRTAAHERLNHQQRAGSFASTAEIDAFFLECDDLPGPSSEPNWGEHLNVIDGSRPAWSGRADDCCRQQRVPRRAVSNHHPDHASAYRFSTATAGEAGRLILNLILVRHGYPPAIIYKRDRARYLRALQRADTGDASGSRRDARSGDSRQPAPLRHPGRRRCGQARATGSAGDPRHEGVGPASGGRPGTAPRHTRIGRPVAQLPHMGRGVPGEPLSPQRNDTGD